MLSKDPLVVLRFRDPLSAIREKPTRARERCSRRDGVWREVE